MNYELEIVARLMVGIIKSHLNISKRKAPNFSQSAAIYFLMIIQLHTLWSEQHNFMTFLYEQGKMWHCHRWWLLACKHAYINYGNFN